MKKHRKPLLCLLLATSFLFSACTPSTEIKALAIVEGVGVDKNQDGSYFVTFQIFNPSDSGGGGGGEANAQATSTKNIQCAGESLFDASRNATKQMGKKLYYSNLRAMIVSKEICENNFLDLIDFLERNHEVPPSMRVYMSEGKAADVLTAKGKSGNISAEELTLTVQNGNNSSEILDQTLGEIERMIGSQTTDLSLPVISLAGGESFGKSLSSSVTKDKTASGSTSSQNTTGKLANQNAGSSAKSSSGNSSTSSSASSSSSSGTTGGSASSMSGSSSGGSSGGGSSGNSIFYFQKSAVFSGYKLAGQIDDKATRGVLWVQGLVSSGVIDVYINNKPAALEIQSAKSKLSVTEKDGKPQMNVDISFTTRLSENESNSYVDENFSKLVTQLQNEAVKKEVQAALDASLKKYNADIFGFGERIYQMKPQLWASISQSWKKDLKTLQVNTTVNSQMLNVGLTAN